MSWAFALVAAGAGLKAAGILQGGRISEAQGKFEKEIAARNQQALERQAKAEREAASLEETRIARKEKIVKAGQRAAAAKSGIGLAGATLSVLADTAFQFSLERNLALRRGLIRGRELFGQGGLVAAQGRWARTLGKQAKKLSYVKAGASILSAAGSFGGGTTKTTTLANQSSTGAAGIQSGYFTSPIYSGSALA